MPTYSAASNNQALGHDIAADQLVLVSESLLAQAAELVVRAARGNSVWSNASDVAAVHVRVGLLRSSREIMKLVREHRTQANMFRRGPCPACNRVQRANHCPGCGACALLDQGLKHIRSDCPVLTGELVNSG